MMAKVTVGSHIPSIMTPIVLITGGPSNKEPKRESHSPKEFKCYICGTLHSYKKCPELNSLGTILQELKEQKAQE